jgi:hypothetical protein
MQATFLEVEVHFLLRVNLIRHPAADALSGSEELR